MKKPFPTEYPAGSFFAKYIDLVDTENVIDLLRQQQAMVESLFKNLTVVQQDYRYAEGKWSPKEMLGHMIDTERIFTYRALCIARGEKQSLPGFDENVYVDNANFSAQSQQQLVTHYGFVRQSTLALAESLTEEARQRIGTANGRNYVERVVIKAIKNDVAIYAAHTNLDNIAGGVSFRIADQLGLQQVRILAPKSDLLMKLVTFVPNEQEGPAFKEATQTVLNALYEAGVGQIGQYDHCSFRTEGTGTFRGSDTAKPALGRAGEDTTVHENRIEAIFPAYLQHTVLAALRKAHPYEEVAHYLTALTNENQEVGSGAVGELPEPRSEADFLAHLKTRMNLSVIRHTALRGLPVRRVAVCGGAGGFLLNDALRAGADVFVTADYKYHEFFDADSRILIADIGHYESEVFTKDLIQQYLLKKNNTFAVILSEIDTNPVLYYL